MENPFFEGKTRQNIVFYEEKEKGLPHGECGRPKARKLPKGSGSRGQ